MSNSKQAFVIQDLSNHPAAKGMRLKALIFDMPGERANKLNREVMAEFEQVLIDLEKQAETQGSIDAMLLLSGKPGIFIAGADIEMLLATKSAAEAETLSALGQGLLSRWEDLPFPTICAINGAAMGGGCELALASTAIVMSDDPTVKIGLPEVNLGVIPGTGGCIRLTQKIGLAGALDLILAGKSMTGDRALKAGIIEGVVPRQDFESNAIAWVKRNIESLKRGERLAREPKLGGVGGLAGSMMESVGKAVILKKAREGVHSKTRGKYPAPIEVIDVLQDTGVGYGPKLKGEARKRAMEREAEGFGRAASTEISKNLIRLYFMTEAVKKSKGLPAGAAAEARAVSNGAVLGAGVMGGGIAQLFADKGIPTRMKDLNTPALSLGIQQAASIFKKQVKRKRLTPRQMQQKLNLIAPVLDYSGFRGVDLVVEAVIEKLEIKQKVFQELESQVSDECVIASNTSSLPITSMASVMRRPERFVGMHFFNPVNKMPLVEVIRGEKTSDEAVTTIFQLSKKLGKTPIVVKDAPGFLVNRLLVPYMNEAVYLLADGAPIEEIDRAFLEFGMPMGPMELIDEVGVDVGEKVVHILNDAFGERMTPAPFNQKLVEAKRLGKKTGKGMYEYPTNAQGGSARDKRLDPAIYSLLGVTPRPGAVSVDEMIERCIYPMINEASRCLEEGIVVTAADVDLGMIMGTGFPPFRGGLMRFADSLGAQKIVDTLRKYTTKAGARFEPSPALVERARSGRKFYE